LKSAAIDADAALNKKFPGSNSALLTSQAPTKETVMMMFKGIPAGRIGNFLAGAAVASVIGGTAVAVTSPNFTYSSAQPGFYAISPMDMAPNGTIAVNNGYSIDYYDPAQLTANGCHNTGVHLPQGAKLKNVVVYFKSGNQSNLSAFFVRLNLSSGIEAGLSPDR
jgi:hypothetical protein